MTTNNDPDWFGFLFTLIATGIGAWLGYLLAVKQEQRRESKLHESLRSALFAEVDICAKLADTYLTQNIIAPAYRMPTVVHDEVFSQLLSTGEFPAEGVAAVIEFYSQVRQFNWCLDQVQGYKHEVDNDWLSSEASRVRAKAKEMQYPNSRFYSPVAQALRRQG